MTAGGEQWLTIAPHWEDTSQTNMGNQNKQTPSAPHPPKPPPYNKLYPVLQDSEILAIAAAVHQATLNQGGPVTGPPQAAAADLLATGPVSVTTTSATSSNISEDTRNVADSSSTSSEGEEEESRVIKSTKIPILRRESQALGQHEQFEHRTRSGLHSQDPELSKEITLSKHKPPKEPPIFKDESQFQAPFMTVGDMLLKKPIEIEDLNKIVKNCPKPTIAPLGTIAYLKKACKGRSYTQEDMKLIIDGVIDHHSKWKWDSITTISNVTNTKPDEYPLNTQNGIDDMWKEITEEMLRVFKARSSLPVAVACKQKPSESIVEFWKRFKKCWKEEAGLSYEGQPSESLLISTFISNLQPHVILNVKQTVSSWTTDTLEHFEEQIYEKEASGCFDFKKPTTTTTPATHNFQGRNPNPPRRGRGRDRNNSRYPRNPTPTPYNSEGRGADIRPSNAQPLPSLPEGTSHHGRTVCYNCRNPGHWIRDCPYKQTPGQTQPQNQPFTQDNKPRFNVDWQSQGY